MLPALAAAPAGVRELTDRVDVVDPDLLPAFLRVLGASDLVRHKDGLWQVTSRARAVLEDEVARAAAIAFGTYYAELYRGLPGQLRGEPARTDLDDHADTIAVLSRECSPWWITPFVPQLPGWRRRGVGRGVRYGSPAGADAHRGTARLRCGPDIAPTVVELARARLGRAGLLDRSMVLVADVESLPSRIEDLGGPVDLVLLANVLYYWPRTVRVRLLTRRERPGPHRRQLLLITTVTAPDLFTHHFDLLLQAQGRGIGLPTTDELRRHLADSGLRPGPGDHVAPGVPIVAVTAQRAR